jgi:hypothetical protein
LLLLNIYHVKYKFNWLLQLRFHFFQVSCLSPRTSTTKLKTKEKDIARFLIEIVVDTNTGELIKSKKYYELNIEKVLEFQSLMGYYSVMSSETELSDTDIIHKYHGLSRIEDSFRITKSDLEARPVFVRNPEHINGHFLTCFCALVMIRLIQYKILKMQGKDTTNEDGWESGLSAKRIKDALNSWQVDAVGGYFKMSPISDDLKLILEAFGATGDYCWTTRQDLTQIKRNLDKSALILL